MTDIAKRFSGNPLLKPQDLNPSNAGLQIECLLNPGVFEFNGKTYLLVRVAERPVQKDDLISFPILKENGEIEIIELEKNHPEIDLTDPRVIQYCGKSYLTTLSHLRILSSDDGVNFKEPEEFNTIMGQGTLESFGIEDCRVTEMDGEYYLTYTAVSDSGVGVGMMSTQNWQEFDRYGVIFPPHNKDCAIINEKIGDHYYAFHRPSGIDLGGNYIWISQSPDLKHWGNHQCILKTRKGKWDEQRIGAGTSPIKTDKGWLAIYHGADNNNRYCLGAFLTDLNDPSKIIARSEEPIMEPIMLYEQTGFFGNVVFTNGHIVKDDEVTIYYGASDEYVCGARFSINEILATLNL